MTSIQTPRFRHSTVQLLLGGVGIALVTFVCFQLGLNTAETGFAYLVLIVVLALMGSFIGSVALSIVAVGCLNYFFGVPLFDFRVDSPDDFFAMAALLTSSLIVAGLTTKLRKTADKARASEQALIDTLPAALIWTARPDGMHDFHSQRWLAYSGFSAAQAADDGWLAAHHPEDRAGVVDKWRSAVATGDPLEVETRLRNLSGEYRWFQIRAQPLRDHNGKIIKWYGSNSDIEERKRAADALRESEVQWREVFEHNPVMYFMVGADGTVLSVNAFGAAQLGYAVDELVGQPVFNVFLEEDRELVQANVAVSLERLGLSNSWEIRKIRKDGTVLWVRENAKAVRRAQDPPIILIAGEDITERKRAEAYQSEAQRLSQTGSFGWRVATCEVLWSAETFRIFQFDRATILSPELILRRVHPDDVARVKQTIERAARDGSDFEYENRLVMPDGFVKDVRVVAHAFNGDTGSVEFVGAVMDITDRKLAEQALQQSGQRLRQAEKMEAVGRLAGGVAHDFNNVLGGIFAYGEMLFEETPAASPLRRYAQNVLAAAANGRALVEQILAYSHSQEGKRAPVDIARVTGETLDLLRGSLPTNIGLEARAPELPLVVIGDAAQLHQVVMNLCSNSIQAMSGGGSLRVALEIAELTAERALSHGRLAPGRYVRLSVEDSGCGIDEATLSRIFEPFFTTKGIGQGTGLGLSLVYAIVTDLEGAIDLKSVVRQGSTFAIYLPLAGIALAAAAAEADDPLPRGKGERVLLIDDEAPLLAATAEMLARLGYEPDSFSNGHAALAAFEAAPGRFDVVVTDEAMPGFTGTGLASALRRHRADLPIVLVSGYGGPVLTQRAFAAGVDEVLVKPLQSREIATTLARVLRRAQ